MSVPTDCDQRDERMGWTGDAALSSEIGVYNYDVAAFYGAWMKQGQDDQSPQGAIPNLIPGGGAGAPNWQTAYPTVIWNVMHYYGDKHIVEEHWASLLRYESELGCPRVVLLWSFWPVLPAGVLKGHRHTPAISVSGQSAHINVSHAPCCPGMTPSGYWDSLYAQTGMVNYTSGFGDWVPPPPVPKSNGHLVGAFAYIRDKVRGLLGLFQALVGLSGGRLGVHGERISWGDSGIARSTAGPAESLVFPSVDAVA